MKTLLLTLFVLIAGSAIAKDYSLSEFEKYAKEFDYILPHPFKNLSEDLRDGKFHEVVGVIQGHSRALNRKKVNFKKPRTLLAVSEQRAIDRHPIFYIGHVKDESEFEVISWNKETRSFDFIVVENYKDQKAIKINKSNKALCMTCHQNGGPIFAREPWDETVDNEDIEYALKENKVDLSDHDSLSEDFDGHVRRGDKAIQMNNICKSLCPKDDITCQKSVFFLSLFANDEELEPYKKELFSNLKNHWPKNNFAYPSSIIADFNPITNETKFLLDNNVALPYLQNFIDPLTKIEERVSSNPLYLTNMKYPIGFLGQHIGNPAFERPPFHEINFEKFKAGESEELKLCYDFSEKFMHPTYNIHKTFNLLFKSDKLDKKVKKHFLSTKHMSAYLDAFILNKPLRSIPDSVVTLKPREVNQHKNPFQKFCLKCHGENSKKSLPLDNLTKLADYKTKEGSNVIDYLKGIKESIMPPKRRRQIQPTESERKSMIQLLESLSK